jgi:hypothetical protein
MVETATPLRRAVSPTDRADFSADMSKPRAWLRYGGGDGGAQPVGCAVNPALKQREAR